MKFSCRRNTILHVHVVTELGRISHHSYES